MGLGGLYSGVLGKLVCRGAHSHWGGKVEVLGKKERAECGRLRLPFSRELSPKVPQERRGGKEVCQRIVAKVPDS